jgi:hypothetical protein
MTFVTAKSDAPDGKKCRHLCQSILPTTKMTAKSAIPDGKKRRQRRQKVESLFSGKTSIGTVFRIKSGF